jgi:hypothetical protein
MSKLRRVKILRILDAISRTGYASKPFEIAKTRIGDSFVREGA